MKLLFMTNVPSPYRVDFFNELGKNCDLTVTFEKKTSDERDKSWLNYKFDHFKGVFLKGKSLNTDTAICFGIKKIIKEGNFDKIICANFSSPTGMIAIRYMRKHHISYYLESDGGFAKSGKGIKEKIKAYFIRGAQGYLSTGEEHDKYYLAYGAKKEKIYRYPFTSLRESDILSALPIKEEKRKLREELGLKEEKIILSVGQFISRKGFDLLIKAAADLSTKVGIYFIGGEPTEEYLALCKSLRLNNIHFVGFRSKEELQKYYQAADLFVFPTREDIWGLVVNEAMANGLGVITTNKCNAGLELIKNGENGYIVPVENVEQLSEKIEVSLEKLEQFASESLKIIKKYTIENMAQRHMEILQLT